ncbi:MAG: protoporphyrinogen oxidase [Thermostichales cyanobacterium DRC_bins_46]
MIVVIGAGISGLVLAWRLKQQGIPVLLREAGERVGGCISTQTRRLEMGDWRWEEGPNSFTPTPALLNLIVELGLGEDLLLADGKLPRFIYWDGRLEPVPLSPGQALSSQLLTLGGKLRALRGLLGFVLPPQSGEETVREFFSRHLGSQVFQRLVQPFVSGVYAGDADQLSAQSAFRRIVSLEQTYGGLLAGTLKAPRRQPTPSPIPVRRGQLGNFRYGMAQLPQTLAKHLEAELACHWRATAIQPSPAGYRVHFHTPSGSQVIEAEQVVLTTPAYVTGELLPDLQPFLQPIPYPPVAVVALGYPETALPQPLRGFGHLIPRAEAAARGLRSLGTIWLSSLFPGRAPQGYHLLLTFIGGATDPGIVHLTPEQRAEVVHRDLGKILLTRPTEPIILGEKLWPRAIPQYTLGHEQRWQQVQRHLPPGIHLCTNARDGVSLGDCVQRAEHLAQQLTQGKPTP